MRAHADRRGVRPAWVGVVAFVFVAAAACSSSSNDREIACKAASVARPLATTASYAIPPVPTTTARSTEIGAEPAEDYSGVGDRMVTIRKPTYLGTGLDHSDFGVLAVFAYDGPGTMRVDAYDSSGACIGTILRAHSGYRGERFVDPGVDRLGVSAAGGWRIETERVDQYTRYLLDYPNRTLNGSSDAVLTAGEEGWRTHITVRLRDPGPFELRYSSGDWERTKRGNGPYTFEFDTRDGAGMRLLYLGHWTVQETNRRPTSHA